MSLTGLRQGRRGDLDETNRLPFIRDARARFAAIATLLLPGASAAKLQLCAISFST